jgi:hypothetical protein
MNLLPEFVCGAGYDGNLRDARTSEVVTVRYVNDGQVDEGINAEVSGWLFDHVLWVRLSRRCRSIAITCSLIGIANARLLGRKRAQPNWRLQRSWRNGCT